MLHGPAVTRLAITLQLLVSLIPIGEHEQLCYGRCLRVDMLSEAGRRLHLLVSSDATAPFIVDIVSIVIGRAVPVEESAVRWDGCEVKPMTWEAPAPMDVAAAIPATTRATLPAPITPAIAVPMTDAAVMKTHAVTGAAIAAIRTMSDGES